MRELLVISQDTSAYGLDRKYDLNPWKDGEVRSHITDLARELGQLGAWVRLHYVYPYPHVRDLIPLMADLDNGVLPYLDIPFQHAHPDVLRRMARPAAGAKTLDEIAAWRADLPRYHPALAPSSSAIPARPRPNSRPCWTGWTRRNWTGSAAFNTKTSPVRDQTPCPTMWPTEVKQDRWDRFMEKAQAISEAKLAAKVGRVLEVIVDEVDDDGRHLPHHGRRARDRREPVYRRRVRGVEAGRYRARSRWMRRASMICGGRLFEWIKTPTPISARKPLKMLQ